MTIVGAGYLQSLGYHAARAWEGDSIHFEKEVMGSKVMRAQPHVRIHYFTRAHRGSTTYWTSDPGRQCLDRIATYLREQVPRLGFWSGNEIVRDYLNGRIAGDMVLPRQEGTNFLRSYRSCAFIYSGKGTPSDRPLREVFGLTAETIERAREAEDLIQFVMRGRLREQGWEGDYDIHVYDRHQAEALAAYLRDEAIARVTLVPVEEAGIMEVARPRGRRPAKSDPLTEKAAADQRRGKDRERKRRARHLEREARKRAGTLRPRGRPRKESPTPAQQRYYDTTRRGLTKKAHRARYRWKDDLAATCQGPPGDQS